MKRGSEGDLRGTVLRGLHVLADARLRAVHAVTCGDAADALRWLDQLDEDLKAVKRQACAWASVTPTERVKR